MSKITGQTAWLLRRLRAFKVQADLDRLFLYNSPTERLRTCGVDPIVGQNIGPFKMGPLSVFLLSSAVDGPMMCSTPVGVIEKNTEKSAHLGIVGDVLNGPETNKPRNGLLLRSDMHALFDLKLIAVDTRTMTLLVSGGLKSTEYADYAGRSLNLPRIEQLAMREVVEYTAARGWSLDPQAMCATRPACGQSQG